MAKLMASVFASHSTDRRAGHHHQGNRAVGRMADRTRSICPPSRHAARTCRPASDIFSFGLYPVRTFGADCHLRWHIAGSIAGHQSSAVERLDIGFVERDAMIPATTLGRPAVIASDSRNVEGLFGNGSYCNTAQSTISVVRHNSVPQTTQP